MVIALDHHWIMMLNVPIKIEIEEYLKILSVIQNISGANILSIDIKWPISQNGWK